MAAYCFAIEKVIRTGSHSVTRIAEVQGDGQILRRIKAAPGGGVGRELLRLDPARLKCLYVATDQEVSVRFDTGSIPVAPGAAEQKKVVADQELTLPKDSPLDWIAGGPTSLPFDRPVREVVVKNLGTEPATVEVIALED